MMRSKKGTSGSSSITTASPVFRRREISARAAAVVLEAGRDTAHVSRRRIADGEPLDQLYCDEGRDIRMGEGSDEPVACATALAKPPTATARPVMPAAVTVLSPSAAAVARTCWPNARLVVCMSSSLMVCWRTHAMKGWRGDLWPC